MFVQNEQRHGERCGEQRRPVHTLLGGLREDRAGLGREATGGGQVWSVNGRIGVGWGGTWPQGCWRRAGMNGLQSVG